jgi:small-conductance mechanosensitive channel
MVQTIVPYLASFITIISAVLVILAGRFILKKVTTDTRIYPYHRQLLTFMVSLLALFIAIALLPINHELRTQILSVLGILLSGVIALSSTTLVGNAMAGIMLRLMHGFRSGDFIQFEGKIGRITDFGIFHTEMQLITRDLVTIPNIQLAGKCVEVTRRAGSFINTAVSIGYDVSHDMVEKALKQAAESCELTEPFVLIEDLGDYSIRYRIHGLLEETSERLSRTSALNAAVLDVLHEQDIEIMSPQIVDRREYGIDHRFMPETAVKESEKGTEKADDGIEELAFDKAEEAASIEQLHAQEEKIRLEIQQLGDKNTGDKKTLKEKKERLNSQLEHLKKEIEQREDEKEQQRIDEETS